MSGIHFGFSNTYIHRVKYESTSMKLLASGDGADIVLQEIKAGKNFYVYPGENADLLEFFYILKGECYCEQDGMKTVLKAGNYFYAHKLDEVVFFKPITNMEVIWFSSQPVFQDVCKSMEELTEIVWKVEQKDSYTYKHTLRVQEYSFKIAKAMSLSKEMVSNVYDAAALHDVGKIEISEEILTKPGRLTEEEYEIMKSHSIIGYHMVKQKYNFNVARIIAQHHERLDGSGYPLGLFDQEICLEAKVIGVADTYDAMTSDRPYRKGFEPKFAMDELKRLGGIQYDSEVVNALEKVLIEEGILKDAL